MIQYKYILDSKSVVETQKRIKIIKNDKNNFSSIVKIKYDSFIFRISLMIIIIIHAYNF